MQHCVQIRLTQDLGHELLVYVAGFTPRPDDQLNHIWYSGRGKGEIRLPPLCLTRLADVRANIFQYVKVATKQYLEDVIKRSGCITRTMLMQAVRFATDSKAGFFNLASFWSCY
jgi:hypothetical protein